MIARLFLNLALALVVMVGGVLLHQLRVNSIQERPLLVPVAFDHSDHTDVTWSCVDCHHNFADETGQGGCYFCHKHDPEVAADIERIFHDLCQGCHMKVQLGLLSKDASLAISGDPPPVRACSGCHRAS